MVREPSGTFRVVTACRDSERAIHDRGCQASGERLGRGGLAVKLTIFAATGRIGREATRQALAAGHDVTAVVRNPQKVPEGVRVFRADLSAPDQQALEESLEGGDAVISCLGATSRSEAGVAAGGTRAIVKAMAATAVRRIVVISAASVGTMPSPARPDPPKHDPGDGFFMRHLIAPTLKTLFRAPYADLAEMEDVLRSSGMDWTIVRAPRLTDKPGTGQYRTAVGHNLKHGLTISRADVAHLMLATVQRTDTVGQVVGIAD